MLIAVGAPKANFLDPSMKSDGKVQNHELKELSIKTKVCNKWLNKIVNYTKKKKKKLHAETSKKICFSSLYISIGVLGMTLNCIPHLWVKRLPQPGWQS